VLAALRSPSPLRRTQFAFAGLMGLASLVGLVKMVVFAKVLGVDDLGLYGLAVLVTQFGVHLGSWGILSALNNQLPIALGRGEASVPALVGRALGATLLALVTTGALYVAVVLLVLPGSGGVRTAMVVAAAFVAATTVFEFVLLLLRVERRLLPLAAMYVARAVVALALGAGAGALWGFGGVIAVEVGVLLVIAGSARRRWLPTVRVWRPRLAETRWLLSRGLSLMVANLIVVGATAVDRVYVAAVLPDELGQYIFATIVVTAWVALSGILTQALAPKYLFEHGAGLPLRAVRRSALRVLARALIGGAVMLPLLFLALAAARRGAFADYRAGLDVMPILFLGGLLNLLAFPGFILAALKPSLATAAAAAGATAAVGGGALLTRLEPDLADFAWLFVASQATVLVVVLGSVELLVRASDRATPAD
jgi:O-antigen/teichoic acid export membrane protein